VIGVRQIVKFDGETVGDELTSYPLADVERLDSWTEITLLGGKHRLEVTIEFDRALVPRDLTL
jgi:hypothetical protein